MRRRLTRFTLAFLCITAAGTGGYMILEGWSVAESLYMTVITLSTVGFGEVRPLSAAGRIFTTGLIAAGVGAVAYLFAAISQYIVSGELTGALRKTRMQQRINALSGHYIVCGFGRVGQQILLDLQGKGKQCVVVDTSAGPEEGAGQLLWVTGDGADDAILHRAGVERAAGLVAATGDDAANLFITLSARSLNPDLPIVARANLQSSEPKLLRAGATHVISPHTISGRRIARQLLYPSVTDFLDVVMHSGSLELLLEECRVREGSDLHDKTVEEAHVRRRTGANVLAVRRHDQGAILTNPPEEMRFEPGDVLIALGTRSQLQELDRLAGNPV
ncbi:MAG: potassium channel protein [Gemmatimonadales bacterium]|nr:potassium channel protein [Gemmatimonadales bacterium]NIN49296.1 potassium channel protein [Gemmatimonadales bacterium]NIP06760.1 potassium channel protein [Gemmatimonadales bacterium]NIR02786.1 potassium channel protein [Gemmatimonadales bacterium]